MFINHLHFKFNTYLTICVLVFLHWKIAISSIVSSRSIIHCKDTSNVAFYHVGIPLRQNNIFKCYEIKHFIRFLDPVYYIMKIFLRALTIKTMKILLSHGKNFWSYDTLNFTNFLHFLTLKIEKKMLL